MRGQSCIVLSSLIVLRALMLFCQDLTAQEYVSTKLTIKGGTPIELRLDETASSETCTVGQTLRFTVTRDVSVNDIVVISAGTTARGEVTHAQKTGSLGEEGVLTIIARETRAGEGTIVPLRATLSETGKQQKALSWLVCPFITGTKCVIQGGTELKAYVDYDTKITLLQKVPEQ